MLDSPGMRGLRGYFTERQVQLCSVRVMTSGAEPVFVKTKTAVCGSPLKPERSEIVLHTVEREFGRRLLFLFRAGCVHGGRHRRNCVHAAGCAEHQCRNCGREDCVHLRLLF